MTLSMMTLPITDDDAAEDDAAEDTDNGNDADEDEVDDEVTTFVVLSYLSMPSLWSSSF
eukprot:CAMPEP_0170903010 /NCGR_PEP_ID=MMETSP0734-20130129/49466_1 /TAXON_ID=186038 /ORGANISM="Fragilariopsis kerguelensis, Strain L26-C5" /LENGTH=58 /DNA_ID=CAMNT_0011298023 /DNA_START=941 /DNA_END=1117 /DNA_ORIENTATION=+